MDVRDFVECRDFLTLSVACLCGIFLSFFRVQRMLSSLLEGQGGVIKKTVDMDRWERTRTSTDR